MQAAIYRRALPSGWYPADEAGVERFLSTFDIEAGVGDGVAAVVPHAGWRFSGELAARGIAALAPAETVVLAGGHLRRDDGIQLLPFDRFETPSGELELDRELSAEIGRMRDVSVNSGIDNSTEVQLPLVARFHHAARIVVLRAAPSSSAVELGETVAEYARRSGRRTVFIGSTDLTHYGPDYGFVSRGRAPEAVDWVREVSDWRFIDALLALDWKEALRLADEERAACSAGAAAAALSFAHATGAAGGSLLGYRTSYDLYPGESIVGYASVVFSPGT